jgi:hypothetical protein
MKLLISVDTFLAKSRLLRQEAFTVVWITSDRLHVATLRCWPGMAGRVRVHHYTIALFGDLTLHKAVAILALEMKR